jgi:hypothetical protein
MTYHPQRPDPLHQADRDSFIRGVHAPDACTLAELPAPAGTAWTIRYDDYAPIVAYLWPVDTARGVPEPLATIERHNYDRWRVTRRGRITFGPDAITAVRAAGILP